MRILFDKKTQSSLIKLYHREGRKVLLKAAMPVLERAEVMNPQDLKNSVRGLLISADVEDYLDKVWLNTLSIFAASTAKRIRAKKEDAQLTLWQMEYRVYSAERSAKITGKVLDSAAENINRILEKYIAEGEAEGLGIPEISRRMRSNLYDDMVQMQRYEAERIARTEVIGASNKGSFDGAMSTGVEMKKFWMTSGLPGVRSSHATFEGIGPVEMSFEYVPGLKHPGDPNGPVEEIVNCRCTHGWQV